MLIKSIFMELRSRLRSCNVFITTSVDLTKNCNLRINLQSNGIILNYYPDTEENDTYYVKGRKDSISSIESLSDCYSESDEDITEIIPIHEFCHIIPNSMSGLKIDKNNISFRILTESKNGGNFYQELLTANKLVPKVVVNAPQIDLKVGEEVKIVCANCVNIVSDNTIKFDRILELPSENIDMTEWFCHNHGGESHDHKPLTLKANKYDLLYRLSYFVLSPSILSDKTNKFNQKRNVYHCNRCLAWLGLKSKDGVKIFNSTIKVTRNETEKHVLHYNDSLTADINLNDFIYTIEGMSKEFNIGFQYAIMCKIVLQSFISSNKSKFLLIWIMDKELQVLRNIQDFVEIENEDKIKLVSNSLTKILYKVETGLTDEVQVWLSDPSIISSEVSSGMFTKGVEHLNKMSQKVPEAFRMTNGYCVSYLQA